MYDVDFLPVGDEGQSGDAIAIRFTRPDTGGYVHVVIDAGFQSDGDALVQHITDWYDTDTIDLAIVTHPDGDHIGGMGTVLRELNVATLCVHRLGAHGGSSLPAAEAVDELIELAEREGTEVVEPFAGVAGYGGALAILGPDEEWYTQLVAAQVAEAPSRAARRAPSRLTEAVRTAGQRFLSHLPIELPFDDRGGTNPRNNTSVVTLLDVDGRRMLFTGDAGVPALDRAWDFLGTTDRGVHPPTLMQIPHAGSRHNASSDVLTRLLGPPGQDQTRQAEVSVATRSVRHPSPRVVNAYMRRGCDVFETRGRGLHWYNDAPDRGWPPVEPLEPMDESLEED